MTDYIIKIIIGLYQARHDIVKELGISRLIY